MLSINWRRGLFRLWIAASFVWLVGGGVMFQEEIRSEFSVMRIEVAGLTDHATPTYDDAMRALRAADEAATSATDPRERQQYEKDARALGDGLAPKTIDGGAVEVLAQDALTAPLVAIAAQGDEG